MRRQPTLLLLLYRPLKPSICFSTVSAASPPRSSLTAPPQRASSRPLYCFPESLSLNAPRLNDPQDADTGLHGCGGGLLVWPTTLLPSVLRGRDSAGFSAGRYALLSALLSEFVGCIATTWYSRAFLSPSDIFRTSRFFLSLNSPSCPTGRITACFMSQRRMWYSISSARSRYCGHNCSCEFTCSTPIDANTLPKPVRPRCLAPQGTACMLSNMALWACFFLSLLAALGEAANTSDSPAMSDVL